MGRRNVQHGQVRRMPWSTRLPIVLLSFELGALVGSVVIVVMLLRPQ